MNDRELLELAARAAGVGPLRWQAGDTGDGGSGILPYNIHGAHWSPLTDDGDALRLAVKLQISVMPSMVQASARNAAYAPFVNEDCGADPYTATRRAIVRAAAAISEAMR